MDGRKQPALTLYLCALYLITACARRKHIMAAVLNHEVISTLGLRASYDNYLLTNKLANDPNTSQLSRDIWGRAAKNSLDRHFEMIEGARQMRMRDYTPSPHWLDKRRVLP